MSGIYAGQVQHVIYEGEQISTAFENGIHVFVLGAGEVLLAEQFSKTQNTVHRCADFVGHVGHELVLETVGLGQLFIEAGQLGQEVLHILLAVGELGVGPGQSAGQLLDFITMRTDLWRRLRSLDLAEQASGKVQQFVEATANQQMPQDIKANQQSKAAGKSPNESLGLEAGYCLVQGCLWDCQDQPALFGPQDGGWIKAQPSLAGCKSLSDKLGPSRDDNGSVGIQKVDLCLAETCPLKVTEQLDKPGGQLGVPGITGQ